MYFCSISHCVPQFIRQSLIYRATIGGAIAGAIVGTIAIVVIVLIICHVKNRPNTRVTTVSSGGAATVIQQQQQQQQSKACFNLESIISLNI